MKRAKKGTKDIHYSTVRPNISSDAIWTTLWFPSTLIGQIMLLLGASGNVNGAQQNGYHREPQKTSAFRTVGGSR